MGRGLCASLRFPGLKSKPSAVGLLQLVVQPHSPARPRERYSADLLPRTLSKVHPGSAQPDVQASSFNVLHLEQQIRGAATHLQCPGQQSPEDPNCILPPQSRTVLLLFSSASRRPQICPSCGGGELASRKEIKQRPVGTRRQWKELAAKTSTASSPKEFFWQRTWLAGVCSGLSEQRGPQMLPCQSCPSSTVEPVLPGDAQPASLSPEVGAGGTYTPSSAPN